MQCDFLHLSLEIVPINGKSKIYTISFGRYKANPTFCLILLTPQKYWYLVVVSEPRVTVESGTEVRFLREFANGAYFAYVTERTARNKIADMCRYTRSHIKGRDHASSSQYKSSLSPPHKLTVYNSDYFPWLYCRHHRKLGT